MQMHAIELSANLLSCNIDFVVELFAIKWVARASLHAS